VFVAVLTDVFVCFVCYRSRLHPVPHNGERVKQRMVNARIRVGFTLTAKPSILVIPLYLLPVYVCSYNSMRL
jgi:hypothetical protein